MEFLLTFCPMDSRVDMSAARKEVFWTPPIASSVMKTPIWIRLSQNKADLGVNCGHSIRCSD